MRGHLAKSCEAEGSRCAMCADLGRPADHRLGSGRCQLQESRGMDRGRIGEEAEYMETEGDTTVEKKDTVREETATKTST